MPDPSTLAPRMIPYEREAGYAARYRDRRFCEGSGPRTHRREVAALRRLLRRAPAPIQGAWLDVPAGAGRLTAELPGRAVQADRNREMLLAAGPSSFPRVQADAAALPFGDRAFVGTLCFRLLHHAPDAAARVAVLRELGRVSREVVVFSFFHSWCLQNARRQLARRLYKPTSGRRAVSLRTIRREAEEAGLLVVAATGLAPGIAEQWLVLARPRQT